MLNKRNKRKRSDKYQKKFAVKGSFIDIINSTLDVRNKKHGDDLELNKK